MQLGIMKAYIKALRNLQHTLRYNDLSVETLAAISILERAETLFDWGQQQYQVDHVLGISYLITKIDLLDPKDSLGTALLAENRSFLVDLFFTPI
jgi:hypothetical protein